MLGALEREAIGVMVKQDLEDLGMKVNFKPIEFNSLVNKLTNTRDWDMAIMGLTGSPLEPHDGKMFGNPLGLCTCLISVRKDGTAMTVWNGKKNWMKYLKKELLNLLLKSANLFMTDIRQLYMTRNLLFIFIHL